MIDGFMKFNESVDRDIHKLKSEVDDAFAYISDDSKVLSYVRDNEVYVDIISILPNNIIYDNIEEYVNKHEIWHETLLDINVAIEQLTTKGNVGVVLNINTVGNVKIKFHISNDLLFTTDNNSIIISKINLTKLIDDKSINLIKDQDKSSFSANNGNEILFYFDSPKNTIQQKEFADKVVKLFYDNGIINSGDEGIFCKTYNYDVNNICIEFYQYKIHKKNTVLRGRYKTVKLKYTI